MKKGLLMGVRLAAANLWMNPSMQNLRIKSKRAKTGRVATASSFAVRSTAGS